MSLSSLAPATQLSPLTPVRHDFAQVAAPYLSEASLPGYSTPPFRVAQNRSQEARSPGASGWAPPTQLLVAPSHTQQQGADGGCLLATP